MFEISVFLLAWEITHCKAMRCQEENRFCGSCDVRCVRSFHVPQQPQPWLLVSTGQWRGGWDSHIDAFWHNLESNLSQYKIRLGNFPVHLRSSTVTESDSTQATKCHN